MGWIPYSAGDRRWILVALAVCAALSVAAHAAAPANDSCAGAQVIPTSGPFPFVSIPVDVGEATTTGDPSFSGCGSPLGNSVWYTFTPAATTFYTISTAAWLPTATTVDKTTVAIFTTTGGCGGTFTLLPTVSGVSKGCSGSGSFAESGQTTIMTQLTAGTQYFIGVWTVGPPPLNAQTSAVQLYVDQATVPPNDTCANAVPLTLNIPAYGTTVGATNDYQLVGSSCFTGDKQAPTIAAGRDTVYSFTAPSAATYEFKVQGVASGADAVIYTSASCPGATPGTPVTVSCDAASQRNGVSAGEHVIHPLSMGETRYIWVDDVAGSTYIGLQYRVEVTATTIETEPNDTAGTSDGAQCGEGFDLNTVSDVDFFTLGSFAGTRRLFAFVDGSAVNDFNLDMRVTTATDTLEHDRAGSSFPFSTFAPVIAGTPIGTTPTDLRINRDEANQTIPGYRLYKVVQTEANAVAESEPNDTTGTSDAGTANFFSGTLAGPAPSADIDFYRTPVPSAGTLIYVSLDGDPLRNNTPIVAKIALLDPDGHVLVEANDLASTSSTASGAGSLTSTTPNSPGQALVYRAPVDGTYYVRVEIGTSSSSSIGAGDYLLSISKSCVAGGGTTTTIGIDTVSPPAGTTGGGQSITLTGSFSGLASVKVGGVAASVTNNTGTQLTITSPVHAAGAVSIDLVPTSGSTYTRDNAFAYVDTSFTDEPLVSFSTKVKAQHIVELREAVDALRVVAGLSPAPWTNPTLISTTPIRAAHVIELRALLEDVAARLGFGSGSYADPGLTVGTLIKRQHVEDLRVRLESIAD